jgi:hypothetical protein
MEAALVEVHTYALLSVTECSITGGPSADSSDGRLLQTYTEQAILTPPDSI